jgi:hypothetical protein
MNNTSDILHRHFTPVDIGQRGVEADKTVHKLCKGMCVFSSSTVGHDRNCPQYDYVKFLRQLRVYSTLSLPAYLYNYSNRFGLLHLNILPSDYQMLIIYTSVCIHDRI